MRPNLAEKILFTSSIFLNFMFYGVLNLSLYFMLPNTYISGGIRCAILGISILLMLVDFSKGDYDKPTVPVYAMLFYFLFFSLIFARYDYVATGYSLLVGGGKLFWYYVIYICGVGSFMLFYVGRHRFFFLLRNPLLVYFPSVLSVIIILIVNKGALSAGGLLEFSAVTDSNRMLVKLGLAITFVISWFYLLYGKNLVEKLLLGPVGIVLSFLNLYICDSRSLYVSLGAVVAFYFFLSLRHTKTFIWAVVVNLVAAISIFPLLLKYRGYERFSNLLYMDTDYLRGSAELSRIDLIKEGIATFFKSPIFGGNVFLKDGFSCHFTPLDVLMATGLIGGIAMFVAFWGSLRGCFWVVKNYPRGYWIVGIYIFCFLDACMHGDATSPFIYALGIALVADCMSRNVANMPISLGGRVNDKLEIC